MYLSHWRLNDFPFENVANPDFYFESEAHSDLTNDLLDAIHRRKGAIALTGEIGCGKSTTTQRTLLQLPEEKYDVALITYSRLSPVEMLSEVAQQLGLECSDSDRNSLVRAIHAHLARNAEEGRSTLICIDEAQSIPSLSTFEELRLLLNFQLGDRFLLSLFFVGQPELRDHIAKLPQLAQRIALNLHLGPLTFDDTVRYILHRLHSAGNDKPIITKQAITNIFNTSGGVPRRINHLMDRCLLMGMRRETSLLDSKLVSETVQRYPC